MYQLTGETKDLELADSGCTGRLVVGEQPELAAEMKESQSSGTS